MMLLESERRYSLDELTNDCFTFMDLNISFELYANNPNVNIEPVVSQIRFPLMRIEHLLHVVRPSGIVSPDKILDAIDKMITPNNLIYRGVLLPEVDLASERYLARWTKHPRTQDFVLELSNFFVVNFIGNFRSHRSHRGIAWEQGIDRT
ncbi:GL26013 [Drosophila persimilis]|uniref:GL26013 n=1 Tax=Drosophila persimilis TaxID=7234 RepID=B4GK53_DROPE|nr:GL26013 [Drosophila persimilis]